MPKAELKKAYELFATAVKEQVSPNTMRLAALAGGKEAVDIIRERTADGLDRKGRAFAKRTPRYMKRKRKLVKTVSRKKFYTGDPDSWLVLSGGLMGSIRSVPGRVRQTDQFLDVPFVLYIHGDKHKKQAGGLIEGKLGKARRPGRDFFGLSYPSSSLWRKEERRVKNKMMNILKVRARGVQIVPQ